MFAAAALSLVLYGVVPVPDTRTPPALEHFIRAEILLQRGATGAAEAELRYALAFDHESQALRSYLLAVSHRER